MQRFLQGKANSKTNPKSGSCEKEITSKKIGGSKPRYEAMNMIRKGQIRGVGKADIKSQVKFIENLFGLAA